MDAAPDPSRPTVYVDARPFSCSRLTGIARYAARLSLALAAHVPVKFFVGPQEIVPPENLGWSQDQDLGKWSRRVWRGRPQPLGEIGSGAIGLYCAIRPPERMFPFEVSVFHDFTPLIMPWVHTEQTCREYQEFFARTVLSSDVALAVSHSTKADATWLSPMPEDRVVTAPSGPSLCVGAHRDRRRTVRRSENIGIVVSTLEPRKNARFLLDWFSTSKALSNDAELWWVGPLGWLTSMKELRAYRRAAKPRKIRFLGVVSDSTLCRLYRKAAWTIYPSLYEGFGFPVLDSLRHGAPVLTSFNSSLREFEGPGLFFFDPCDASTVDQAYLDYEKSKAVPIPVEKIDAQYTWDSVGRALLDAHQRMTMPERHARVA